MSKLFKPHPCGEEWKGKVGRPHDTPVARALECTGEYCLFLR